MHFRVPCLCAWFLLVPFFLTISYANNTKKAPASSDGPVVQVVETTGDRAKLLERQPDITFGSGESVGFTIAVNEEKKYQQMDGFGASLTDSSAWLVWNKLTPSQQSELWQSLFSSTAAIGLSFLRLPMGASDFSAIGNYSYDDVTPPSTDVDLTHFSVAHDTEYIVPLLKRALEVNPSIKVMALPWSAPAWMKTSGTMNGGGVNPSYFPVLARYFVEFLKAYKQLGIPIYAISVQNEPRYSTPNYPTEELSAADESLFIGRNLGPALRSAGFGNVKIFGYEHNWDKPAYPETLLQDKSAAKYLSGTSFHCYAGNVAAQSEVKNAYPKKDIWFTECSGVTTSHFANDLVWNAETLLIGATRNWARSVSIWNLVLNQNSGPTNGGCLKCRGVATIDTNTSPAAISYNVEYYVLGHIAKFVLPGAFRVESNSGAHGEMEDVAFRNPDGSIVLLVLNSGAQTAQFNVKWRAKAFAYSLPAGAVATFSWK